MVYEAMKILLIVHTCLATPISSCGGFYGLHNCMISIGHESFYFSFLMDNHIEIHQSARGVDIIDAEEDMTAYMMQSYELATGLYMIEPTV